MPTGRGTSGYLIKAVPGLDQILSNNNALQHRVETMSALIKEKRAGNRGHFKIDIFTITPIILMFILSILLMVPITFKFELLFLLGNGFGFVFVLISMTFFQRNPCKKQLDKLIADIQNKQTNSEGVKT